MDWLDLLAVQGTLQSLLRRIRIKHIFCCCSVAQSCLTATPWTTTHQVPLSITNSRSLPRLMSIELMMPFNHFTFCRSLLLRPQSFPASGSFPMSQLFASGGQSIGDLASASVLPMSIQGWFPLLLTGLISLVSKGLSRVFSSSMITCVSLLYSPSWTLTICVLSCKFYFNRMFAFTNDCEWYFLICKQ